MNFFLAPINLAIARRRVSSRARRTLARAPRATTAAAMSIATFTTLSALAPVRRSAVRRSAPARVATPPRRGATRDARAPVATTTRALPLDYLDHAAPSSFAYQLAANANELVDGCGVNGTCGNVEAPPFALIGGAIVISAAVLFSVRDV